MGRGLIIADFQRSGVVSACSDEVNSWESIGASWYEQSLSTLGISPSGPGPLRGFSLLSCFRTVSLVIVKFGAICGFGVEFGSGSVRGFSKRAKNLLSSSGSKFVLVLACVFGDSPLSFLMSVHALAGSAAR